MKFLLLAALVAFASAEAPLESYGPPSTNFRVPPVPTGPTNSYAIHNDASFAGSSNQAYSSPELSSAHSSGGHNHDGPIESQHDLELENEGANIPNEIVDSEILNRVIGVLSQDLAQQEAAQANAPHSEYGVPADRPPSHEYGVPSGGDGRRIMLISGPSKARLAAYYVQRESRPLSPEEYAALSGSHNGGYGSNNNIEYEAADRGSSYNVPNLAPPSDLTPPTLPVTAYAGPAPIGNSGQVRPGVTGSLRDRLRDY